ncbi:hypothetical protein [Sebaldella sp. S0638]|uniref:hypothetical protein n=1 Tax=Sebaldella sp. S0638 TaxID=2957809 RepID=UPI0020A130D5|nr:hypothetical protein [Sebaldella sp. S0638]MCP1224384.1 hypothetical protein [Sebaldella sp. S0638]
MKRILFVIICMLGILSCGVPKELTVPDKHLSYKDGIVLYKEKPYTGKVKLKKIADKEQFEEGFIDLKDGRLYGITDFKNDAAKTHFKFNVKDGKFDGEYILKHPLIGEFSMNFENGELKELKGKFPNDISQDLIFDKDGNVNGLIEQAGEQLDFQGGVAVKDTLKVKMFLDPETKQKLITEVYEGDKLMAREENILLFTVKDFEEELLPVAGLK